MITIIMVLTFLCTFEINTTWPLWAKTNYLFTTGYPQGPYMKNHPTQNTTNTTYESRLVDITTTPGAVDIDLATPDGQNREVLGSKRRHTGSPTNT